MFLLFLAQKNKYTMIDTSLFCTLSVFKLLNKQQAMSTVRNFWQVSAHSHKVLGMWQCEERFACVTNAHNISECEFWTFDKWRTMVMLLACQWAAPHHSGGWRLLQNLQNCFWAGRTWKSCWPCHCPCRLPQHFLPGTKRTIPHSPANSSALNFRTDV